MTVPIANTCCFCISTRRGLLAFIYLKLILQAILLLILTGFKFSMDEAAKQKKDDDDIGMVMLFNVISNIFFFVSLAIILIELPFNICGLVGAHKESLSWLNVYYYFSLFCVVLYITGLVYQAIEGSYQIAISVVICIAINIYILFVAKGEKTRLESRNANNPNQFGLPPSRKSPQDSGYVHV